MSDTALEATTAEREAYFAAKASGDRSAKKKAGEELGLAGADQYMQKDVKARRVYEQQTTNGNFDLDRVYEKDGWLFVVEAKVPNARPTPRQLSSAINPVTGYPDYSMEGSLRYLRDTIDQMKNGNRASKKNS
ncbi:MAG: hypothetical protein U0840_28360 [Gemmataceae bacterium]